MDFYGDLSRHIIRSHHMDSLDSMDYTGLNSCHGFLENGGVGGVFALMIKRSP